MLDLVRLIHQTTYHLIMVASVYFTTDQFICVLYSCQIMTASNISVCTLNVDLLVIVVYRPSSENVANLFFDDFADLLERVAAYASPLLIVGDLNVHLDDEANSSTIKFQHLLAAHGLVQHVQSATHVGGHTLDVVITRGETPVNLMQVDPPTLSDHSLIIGQLDATSLTGVDPVLSVRRRCWQSFDIDAFSLDLSHRVSLLME